MPEPSPEIEKWYGCYKGQRGEIFCRASNAHPAKMSVSLCFKIFQYMEERGWITKGDLILDPMAGIFTSGIVGAILGYRVLGCELEKHFIQLAQENIEFARQKFHSLGNCWIVQGDARNLRGVDLPGAVTSPPYADQQLTGEGHFRSAREPDCASAADNPREGYAAGAVSSPPYCDQSLPSGIPSHIRSLAKQGKWDEAIARSREYEKVQLERGWIRAVRSDDELRKRIEQALEVDGQNYSKVGERTYSSRTVSGAVASPPYGGKDDHGPDPHPEKMEGSETIFRGYDAVIDSPPYPMPEGGKGEASNRFVYKDRDPLGPRQYIPGNLDGAVASPPYSETHVGNPGEQELAAKGEGRLIGTSATGHGGKGRHGFQYSHDETAQIGNLRDPKNDVDAVLSSPPWEKGARGGQQGWSDPEKAAEVAAERYKTGERKGHSATPTAIKAQMERDEQRVYGESEGQIGNLRQSTEEIEALLSVEWCECD